MNHENEFSNLVTRNFGPFQSWKEKGREGDPFAASRVAGYLRRPEFELYDLEHDPWALNNLAESKHYREQRHQLEHVLRKWMKQQGDRGAETERQALERQTEERSH